MTLVCTPRTRTAGRVSVDVGAGPIARMFPADAWREVGNTAGGAVFDGRCGEVVASFDEESDREHPPAGLFNLDAHIHDTETGHPVPYRDVHVTLTHGGDEVFSSLPLVPVARPYKGTAGLHYGNNVLLYESGGYRVVVQLEPSPLTGITQAVELWFVLEPAS